MPARVPPAAPPPRLTHQPPPPPPGVGGDRRGGLFGPTPTPTPRLNIADGRYFFVPEVPWGTLTLDGHPFAAAIPGDANVPMLPVGRHTLEWRAAPFHTLRCLM